MADVPRVVLKTPREAHRACAISTIGIEGWEPGDLADALYDRYKIFTVSPGFPGVVRISPNVYTTRQELDAFVAAIGELADS